MPETPDFTEREQEVSIVVRVPVYGSDVHVERLRNKIEAVLSLSFPNVAITDVDSETVEE